MRVGQVPRSAAIAELDEQNERIVNCGRAIVKGLMLREPTEALMHRFDTLIELLEIQFGREGFLSDKGVLRLEKSHYQNHIKILDEVHRLRNSIHDGVPSTPYADFVKYFIQHVAQYDMEYKTFCQVQSTESFVRFASVE